ncbi:MAG: hydroxyquinol 1,2-dioxygenase, partial [Actinomycetia bacterium]|nr:hydroxyquinol 1,2-dioxygenase [Actinomycetes bacterium]
RIELAKVSDQQAPDPGSEGSVALDGEPAGPRMGEITARRGHMTLLPQGAAYRFHAEAPGVILMQTIEGPDTVYKWAEIVQTTP